VTVVDPVPWHKVLPGRPWHGLSSGPDNVLDGIELYHPTLWYVPIVGRGFTWWGVYQAARRVLRSLASERYDVVLATFGCPHGYAAMRLAAEMGIPYVVKVRGSDLHTVPRSSAQGRQTAEALRRAAAVVAVSGNLAAIALEAGAPPKRVHVLSNGVDVEAFPLVPREEARKILGLAKGTGQIVLFVGNLLPVKGVDVLLQALCPEGATPDAGDRPMAVLAGDGPIAAWAARQAARGGLGDRVRFLGQTPRRAVSLWMNAADVLVLPSRNEGCPNVVLEALSSGTPVVASRVGAVPDLVDETCGLIVEPGDPTALSGAIRAALSRDWDRAALRRRVEGMTWEANAERLYEILAAAVSRGEHAQEKGHR
jgi:glycosyltransferase involved in cell wall biosynthesis